MQVYEKRDPGDKGPVQRPWGSSGSGICEEQLGGPCGWSEGEDEQGSWRDQEGGKPETEKTT